MWEHQLRIALLFFAATSAMAAEEQPRLTDGAILFEPAAAPEVVEPFLNSTNEAEPSIEPCDFEPYWIEPTGGGVAFYVCGTFDLGAEIAALDTEDVNFAIKVQLLRDMAKR